ncbi:hypothetical protein JW926_02180 [Candidatus Sumerlaeota bacterium]|nr:hypothetical protein [Candidatus Sumerlaeota bacterium]
MGVVGWMLEVADWKIQILEAELEKIISEIRRSHLSIVAFGIDVVLQPA